MDKLFQILDLKRWVLLLIPFFILIGGFYFSSFYIYDFIKKKNSFGMKKYIGHYNLLLNLNLPEKEKKFNPELFDLFNLISFEVQLKQPVKKEQVKNIPPPNYKIELIYIRDGKKYVIINGKILMEGSKISDKEYIIKISKDGILLNGYWGVRWVKF